MTTAVTNGFQPQTTSCTRATMNVVTSMTDMNARPAIHCERYDTLHELFSDSKHACIASLVAKLASKLNCSIHNLIISLGWLLPKGQFQQKRLDGLV